MTQLPNCAKSIMATGILPSKIDVLYSPDGTSKEILMSSIVTLQFGWESVCGTITCHYKKKGCTTLVTDTEVYMSSANPFNIYAK